jgi:hypothetical protein
MSASKGNPITRKFNSKAKTYLGAKIIKGMPLTLGEYNAFRGWDTPENEDPNRTGYLVEYPADGNPNVPGHDGYVSWSPEAPFDAAHAVTELTTVDVAEVANMLSKPTVAKAAKTLKNSEVSGAKVNVNDLVVVGNGDELPGASNNSTA